MIKLETFKSGNRVKQDLYYFFIPNHINDFWKWDNSDQTYF